ncbi:MAG: ClbS/DfsB family four-helix bundle protein [Thermoflexales bacterium]|nr:ClbS/DfsB family four-helix bundle protein [Thermoflexales bacterium]
MPRPTDKKQLLDAMQKEHQALEKLLSSLTSEQMTHVSPSLERSAKDVLAHLIEWEQMCLGWYQAGLRGEKPPLPAEGFNWAQLPALNQHIYEKHRDLPLEDVMKQFQASYQQILQTVQELSQEELFTPGHYSWTGKNAMAAYFIGSTSSHYVWAKKEVKKCLKD